MGSEDWRPRCRLQVDRGWFESERPSQANAPKARWIRRRKGLKQKERGRPTCRSWFGKEGTKREQLGLRLAARRMANVQEIQAVQIVAAKRSSRMCSACMHPDLQVILNRILRAGGLVLHRWRRLWRAKTELRRQPRGLLVGTFWDVENGTGPWDRNRKHP